MAFRPETARPLNEIVEILLAGPSTLTKGERELIATYVSSRNCTFFCASIHGAIAAAHLGGDEALVKQVKTDFTQADISPKLKALLVIAGKVQQDGKLVTIRGRGSRSQTRRYRSRDSRHCPDRGCLLHVQPLCRRPRHRAARR